MLRLARSARSLALLLSALAAGAAAGCGGGGGGRGSTSAAPVTSATPGPSSTASTTSAASVAAPDFGGQVAALASAATPVRATLQTNAFAAFRESSSISDLVIPDLPGLRDRAFVVEDKGSIRILDLSGAAPRLDRAFALEAAPLAAGIATGALTLVDEHTATVTASGRGGEAVYVFDPSTARVAADVTKLDLVGLSVTWPVGTLNSKGVDVGGQARPLSYTAGALVSQGRVLFCSSNLDASFDLDPGTVVAYDWNPTTKRTSGGYVVKTSRFNPTALTAVRTAKGEALLVTNQGPYGTGPGSIDVLDAASLTLVGTIECGARNPSGPVVVSPDGRRGYVASAVGEVYVLDLEGLGDELANATTRDLSARFRGGVVLPGGPAGFTSGLALSRTGNYLYAVDFNQSALFVLDLAAPGLAAKVVGFARTGSPSSYQDLANKVAVRPGRPGVDFSGPSVLVMTINIPAADRTLTNVSVALDAVTLDLH